MQNAAADGFCGCFLMCVFHRTAIISMSGALYVEQEFSCIAYQSLLVQASNLDCDENESVMIVIYWQS